MDSDCDGWQSNLNYTRREWKVKEDLVISGMSGRYPKSENIQEFAENLFNGVDMMSSSSDRYPAGRYGFPLNCGKVQNLSKFDAEFFKIPEKDAHFMDPQLRKLLEVSFEAIVDAGINVETLNGSNTGFFYGSCFHETDMAFDEDPLGMPKHKQNYSTKVSQTFGLKGPVAQFDTACASGLSAISEAFTALKSGLCDRALVASFNICLVPGVTHQFRNLSMTSVSGKCRSLDKSADGYGRGEAVCCMVLQFKSEAKRIYSTVVNCRTNTGSFKDQGITFPSMISQRQLMAETWHEVDLDPSQIDYIEAHATGTQVGDPVEIQSITDVFCYERSTDNPLKIGCIKSNMGHSEAAAGFCAITKANIIFQTGLIPPNLHFKTPNPRIESLMNGKVVPVCETTTFEGEYIPVNAFGFGGANANVILRGYRKKSSPESYQIAQDISRLVLICNRTKEGIDSIVKFLEEKQSSLTREFFDLFNQYSKTKNMPFKDHVLINKNQDRITFHRRTRRIFPKSDLKKVMIVLPAQRIKFDPLFNGISVFSATLDRLAKIIKPLGIDLSRLLFDKSSSISICEEIVATVASHIILINLFNDLKVPISGFIGTSIGRLTFDVAKNFSTEEKVIAAAYILGYLIDHENLLNGEILPLNGIENQKSIANLEEHFGEKILCAHDFFDISDTAFRAKVDQALMNFRKYIKTHSSKNLIKFLHNQAFNFKQSNEPKISSNIQKESIFGFINQELCNQAINDLSPNTVIIDLTTNGTLNCSDSGEKVKFLNLDTLDVDDFLNSIGILYTMHIPIDIDCLYSKVNYPVPIDTLSLHSLINFDHSKEYSVFKYPQYYNDLRFRSYFIFKVALSNPEDRFYSDHKIDGRILFPATGMLMFAWITAAKFHKICMKRSKFLFRDVSFIRSTVLMDKEVQFKISYMPNTGSFIIMESGAQIAFGKIFVVENIDEAKSNYMTRSLEKNLIHEESMELSEKEIYKELKNRGYDYGPFFQCLVKADRYGGQGKIEWKDTPIDKSKTSLFGNNYDPELITWITFADSLIQLALLSNRFNRALFLPISIESILIDAEKIFSTISILKELNHREECKITGENLAPSEITEKEEGKNPKILENQRILFNAIHDTVTRTLACEGLWIRGLKASPTMRRPQKVLIGSQDFIPFEEESIMDSDHRNLLRIYIQICQECIAHIRSKDVTKQSQMFGRIEAFKRDMSNMSRFSIELLEYLINYHNENKFDVSRFDQDILIDRGLHSSSLSRFLQPFITTALHAKFYSGQTNSSFNVIEYNNSETLYMEKVKFMVKTLSTGAMKTSYTVMGADTNPEMNEANSKKASQISWDVNSPLNEDIAQADLLIYKNTSENISSFCSKVRYLIQWINSDGFLFIVFRESISKEVENICSIPELQPIITDLKAICMNSEDVISMMEDLDWVCVSNRLLEPKIQPIRGLLFRKKPDTISQPKIVEVSPFNFEWIEELKAMLRDGDKTVPICLVGDQRYDQCVVGLMKSLGLETNDNRMICVVNRYHDQGLDLRNMNFENPDLKQILIKRLKFNIYDPVNGWGQCTSLKFDEKRGKTLKNSIEASANYELKILQPGDMSSLRWCEFSDTRQFNSPIKNCYAALNFKDVLLASARLPQVLEPSAHHFRRGDISTRIGLEYAGYDENGQGVFGIGKGMATKCERSQVDFDWPIPEGWTLEDAATVPTVYGTVIYGLVMRGNLKRGESVLIHLGSGGVGIAAIHLCLSYDCTIYTTVGTPEKRKFILDTFPQLTEANIGNSRDTSFEEMVLRETEGRGVDIVLNSLIGDKLQASVRCLAPGGRFLEIGKYDIIQNNPIDLEGLKVGQSFHGVALEYLFDESGDSTYVSRNERQKLKELIDIFSRKGIIKPLPRTVFPMDRTEDAFRYMAAGKHIGKVLIKIRDPENPNDISLNSAIKTVEFPPNKAYIVIGGFGGFGLEVALWMAFNGAKHIVINSRSGPQTSYHQYSIDRMVENNVKVVISKHDLATESGVRQLFNSLTAPVGGIFNSTLAMHDALFMDQTEETFAKVCKCKVNITRNMDKISREMCPSLDYFVVFSSVASARGNVGQTNYSLANSYMESVCERRRRDGLHGLAIQWGYIGDVGFVVEKLGSDVQSVGGTAPQRLHSCLGILNRTISCPKSTVYSMVVKEDKELIGGSSRDVIETISHILGITNIHSSDPDITLGELGMDSLMAIEIQQIMEHNYNISMTSKETRQLKIRDLIELSKQLQSTGQKTDNKFNPPQEIYLTEDQLPVLPDSHFTKFNHNDKVDEIVFVIPPIEGQYDQLMELIKTLKQSVVGLNWTYDLVHLASFEEAVKIFADRISDLMGEVRNRNSVIEIKMIGYSYGGVIGLALAKHFEKCEYGLKVAKLVLIDADPELVKNMISKMISSITSSDSEESQESQLIMGLMKQYLTVSSQLGEIFDGEVSKAERIDVAKKYLIQKGLDPVMVDSISRLSELTLQKCRLMTNHEVEAPNDCEIIHLRARESFPSPQHMDMGTQFGEQLIMDGNHKSFIGKNLAKISARIEKFFGK